MTQSNFRVRKGLTVDGDSTLNGSAILTGTTSGQVSLTAPAVAGTQAYTLPTALPASNGQLLTSTTGGVLGWTSVTSGTTYTINASTTTGGANFNLVGSDSTTDTIKFQGAGATAVSRVNADTIEIFSTDNNTTYTLGSSVATGGANLVLYGSDLVNSSTLFNSGTGVTIGSTGGGTAIKINIGQDVATSSDVTFNSVSTATLKANDGTTALTLTNATGDVTTNRYLQVNGNRILNSAGTPTFYFDASGNASVASNFTILGNILKAWNGSASVTAITMSATGDITTAGNLTVGSNLVKASDGTTALTLIAATGDVTTAGNLTVGGNNIKASDGTTAAILATSTGDITYASRLLSSASKTIRNGSNRTTSYASITGATAEDILTIGIGASGIPVNGILATNADLPTGSTSGRRTGILIRNYGGSEYNGVAASTPPQGTFMAESSRGTAAEPRTLTANNPLVAFSGFGNAGSDLTSGNTPYWIAQQYPVSPSFGLVANQTWKGPYGAGATSTGGAIFTATIAASSTNLVVSSVSAGTLAPGQEIRLATGANWSVTSNVFQILSQSSGTTGGAGTYVLNANPGTYTSGTVMWAVATALGTNFFMNLVPQNTPLTSVNRVTQAFSADGITLRAQSANTSTNIFQVNSWPTTVYGGTGTGTAPGNFVQGTNKTYLGISDQRSAFSHPVQFPGYTAAAARALTGSVGWQICITDSAAGSNPNGMMAFWDTTNSRWSYIHDNSAV